MAFKLTKKIGRTKIGSLVFNKKEKYTPTFFMTSDFGGGGTNIPRLFSYLDAFEKQNQPILLNYYYLSTETTCKPRFNADFLKKLPNYSDLVQFFKDVREDLIKVKKEVIPGYRADKVHWDPIFLLDSGSGNMLRDLVKSYPTDDLLIKEYEKIIPTYHSFADKTGFNMAICIDFAKKYTYKKGETRDELLSKNASFFQESIAHNKKLNEISLKNLRENNYKPMFFAPLHGASAEQYAEFTKETIELENKIGKKFDGFAIGGALVDIYANETPSKSISEDLVDSIFYSRAIAAVSDVLETNSDNRPIHVLGQGNIFNILPFALSGADTFDNHSAWRRASDGNMFCAQFVFNANKAREMAKKNNEKFSFSKYLVPSIRKDGEVIKENKDLFWEYTRLSELPDDIQCDCSVCKRFPIKELKGMYSKGGEYNYYSKILIYEHAIEQHEAVCEWIRKNIDEEKDFYKFPELLPPSKLKEDLVTVLDILLNKKASQTTLFG